MARLLTAILLAALYASATAGCADPVVLQADTEYAAVSHTDNLRITLKGRIERLTDDGRDIAAMATGSELSITEGGWLRSLFIGGDTLLIRGLTDGRLEREYYVSGQRHPYEPDGAARLAALMPRLIAGGMATQARIDQLLRTVGPSGVLDEITVLESDYVEAAFLRRVLLDMDPSPVPLAEALALAGREIGSDYELARLLRSLDDRAIAEPASRDAFFGATAGIASDYELQRVLAEVISLESVTPGVIASALGAATTIGSDYEMSRLLQSAAKQSLAEPVSGAFFKAAQTIASDYELRQALDAVLNDAQASDATIAAVLDAAMGIGSDYELARLLTRIAAARTLTDPLRQQYLAAADTLGSSYEQNRALAALVRKSGT
jgi:hypothetical protein